MFFQLYPPYSTRLLNKLIEVYYKKLSTQFYQSYLIALLKASCAHDLSYNSLIYSHMSFHLDAYKIYHQLVSINHRNNPKHKNL